MIKEAKVEEIRATLEKAQTVILTNYQGLTVEEDTQLRKQFREAGVEYKVFKNTLVKLALKELGIEGLDEHLEGPVSIALGYEDPTAPGRVISAFVKEHKALELKAGLVQGEVYDLEKITEFASIPPKEVLLGKLLGSLQSPISKFAYLVKAIAEKNEA
ncbi:50S ribosomal protein L10 [Oceanirhabdus seepicola]|uniref:Large ribosomal subunit protein uL10 n=2 Tax=Oceanirhabdus seepicola TaxID=2828781 RepID=A0A9J6NZB6_9CLOT|nr:50S ribosomal protein L10 [Oceanirhabdus seepicola]MCM1989635.1 50S ribosomal protein L10 [Oceanirhabdus seepicola]